jgi:1-acyl-sn-glycerol-3-phosphate acyltransferase
VLLPSILKFAGIGLNTMLLSPAIVAAATVDPDSAYHLCRLWVTVNLLVSNVRVHAVRARALDPTKPYVFMSNHCSFFDVLAVMDALPEFQLRWVAKKELTDIPIFGWALRHTDHIIIDRSDRAQAVSSLQAARTQMERGVSVIIFPEGTRSDAGDTRLLPFKKGGFMLALDTGIPIVPIAVRGSTLVLPKGEWEVADGDIDVVVGEPMDVTGLDRDVLMTRVRERMEALLDLPAVPAAAQVRLAEAH